MSDRSNRTHQFAIILSSGSWLTWERVRLAAIMSAVGYILSFLAVQFLPNGYSSPNGTLMMDYLSFWIAGREAALGVPELVYVPSEFAQLQNTYSESDIVFAFFYPPLFQMLLMPFGLLAYQLSFFLFAAATTACLAVALKRVLGDWRYALCLLAVPACANNFLHGQNGAFSAALLAVFLLGLERSRSFSSGLALGLMTFKPQFGLLIPFALLAGGHVRVFAVAAVTAIAAAGVSYLVLGADTWAAFLAQVSVATRALAEGWVEWTKMISLYGGLRVLGVAHETAFAIQIGVAGLGLAHVVYVWRKTDAMAARSSVLLGATLLATPFALSYDATVLLVPIAFLVRDGLKAGFLPFEKSLLALIVVLSASTSPIAIALGLPAAPLLVVGIIWLGLRRARL